ncbi:MAG: hypothetical protein PHD81_02630 [Candidatus Nanoarchaeia archaeon]|nr:hypothetical protein [Candidatus Nanoarchaeia archaeon]MDD5587981.1 hypothetical protein [Candidatus Nanoarchaeia archaeon]
MKKRGKFVKKTEKVYEYTLREGNISLVLDSYGDLFSGFDPRAYSERSLSTDFLTECKRASIDKPEEGLELRLLIPKQKRSLEHEAKIRRRLKEHFDHHFKEKENEIKEVKKEGIIWFIAGIILMLISVTFLHSSGPSFLEKLMFIIFEPAGWFFVWEGLSKEFIKSKENKPEYIFYRKMKNAKISFFSY